MITVNNLKKNNLKEIRKDKKFTFKRDMANFLNFNEANYGKMENRKMVISKPLIEALENKFPEYNINWILHDELPKFNTEKKEDFILNEPESIYTPEKPNTNTYMNSDLLQERLRLLEDNGKFKDEKIKFLEEKLSMYEGISKANVRS